MSNQSQAVATANPTADQMEKITTYMPIGYMDEVNLTANIVKKYLCQPTKTGQVCSDRDAIRFVMLCKGLRLNPFAQDAYLVGYDSDKGPQFSLITSHAALLKRAESAKEEYEGMESGIIYQANKDDKEVKEREGDFAAPGEIVLGGWAKVYRKGRKVVYRRLSISAMMPKFPSPFWHGEKAYSQITKCAESDSLRSAFPALCAGLYIEGEHRPIVDISSEVVNENRKPEATGLSKALNTPRKSVTQQIREGAKGEVIHAPETAFAKPEAEPAPRPETQPTPPEEVPGDAVAALADEEKAAGENVFKPRPSESVNLTAVRKLLFEANKPEEQFLSFALNNSRGSFIKEGQKLADLSEVKLERIASSWKELLKQMG